MTYPAHRRNLHGIMYLPYDPGVTPSKKIGPPYLSAGNLPAGTAREPWRKTG